MRAHLAASLLAIVAAGGCYASAGYSAGYVAPAPVYTTSATVSVDTYQPDLVDVGGGVRVIADYDEPVFYTDNFYWRYYGGTWYRSSVYNGGWVVYNDVPYSVRRIDRPHAYVRYRPSGYVPRARRDPYYGRGPAVRDYRTSDPYYRQGPRPVNRDHRTYDGGYRGQPTPVNRDHRTHEPQPRGDYRGTPVQRDHRASEPQPRGDYRGTPVQRDHRDSGRDDRRDSGRPVNRDHRR